MKNNKPTTPQTISNDDEFARLVAQEMLIESATEKILELMEREHVSKAELARRIGKSRAFITQVMDGSRNMTLRTVADLAYALGYELRLDEADRSAAERTQEPGFWHQIRPHSSEQLGRSHDWARLEAWLASVDQARGRPLAPQWGEVFSASPRRELRSFFEPQIDDYEEYAGVAG